MRIRSFVVAYSLVLALLLFAERRPTPLQQDHYSHVVDLTAAESEPHAIESSTRIIAPGAIIPGTWAAGQIPPQRLVAPLVVMDLKAIPPNRRQISLDDIAAWESQHGLIPQGAVVAIRHRSVNNATTFAGSARPLPIDRDAAQFLVDARYTIGFAVETPVDMTLDRTLARQLALHGSYVLERTAPLVSLPATGSLIIVAPVVSRVKDRKSGDPTVRVLAMVR
jgi:kynurenine formamidase